MAESPSCLAVTDAVFESRLGSSETSLMGGENFDKQIMALWHFDIWTAMYFPSSALEEGEDTARW